MQRFIFTAPALPLRVATLGDEKPQPLQIDQPASSRTEVLKLSDEGNVMVVEAPSGVQLCLE